MDFYKKIIRSRELRLKILGLTEFVPDKLMIRLQYWIKTGKILSLKNPVRFNEKLQWYKLYYHDPLMTDCADKYKVRDYVKKKGLEEILVPLYGAYDNAEEIDFEALPDEFVIKTNNGAGSNTNIICTDKTKLNKNEARKEINSWLMKRTLKAGREWVYYNIEPKIISEKYLEDKDNPDEGLIDYKFYCFNGKAAYVVVVTDVITDGLDKNGIFDLNFNQLPYCRTGAEKITTKMEKPKNFDRMCEIADKLSEEFPHVRVDLYNIKGEIFFGELTFYDNSGYQIFEPDEFDFILGELFTLNKMIL